MSVAIPPRWPRDLGAASTDRATRWLLGGYALPIALLAIMGVAGMLIHAPSGEPIVHVGRTIVLARQLVLLALSVALLSAYEIGMAYLRTPTGPNRTVEAWRHARSGPLHVQSIALFVITATLCSVALGVMLQWKQAIP